MASRHEPGLGTTESTSAITFDANTEQFRATFDSDRDSTSLAVVNVIATVNGVDPLELTPLQSGIETTALDKLTSDSEGGVGGCDSISFRYENCQVTVRSEGVIEAIPASST